MLRNPLLALAALSVASLACFVSVHTTIHADESGTMEIVVEIPYEDP